MIEPSLFDAPAAPASRASDPSTSHDAAASLAGAPLRREQARVLLALAATRDGGTPYELVEWYAEARAVPENCIASRLAGLDRAGLVERAGDTRPGGSGRAQRVARLSEAGRAAVADARRLLEAGCMKRLSMEDVARRLDEIRELAEYDDEQAHECEDSLRSTVLKAIASRSTVEDPADLAALALTSRAIEFSRWYA